MTNAFEELPQWAATKRPEGAREASLRVARWLLDSPAQFAEGPHRGGVCGWLDADGRPEYVYPEITGYFLQWLAWLAFRGHARAELAAKAVAAQAWLRQWIATPPLRTRVYLHEPWDDWRNDATFSFDLSMALRGIASAARMGLVKPDDRLVRGLADELAALRSTDGGLEACKAIGTQSLPVRWSTRPGAFLAKAAAGIISADTVLRLPIGLVAMARRTFEQSLEALDRRPHDELHARLYAIEGALALPTHRQFPAALHVARRELSAIGSSGKALCEMADGSGRPRLDVRAQFARSCAIAAGFGSPGLLRLAEPQITDLHRHMAPSGAMPFDPSVAHRQHNVWCAMFAQQAFDLTSHEAAFNAAHAASLLV